MSAGGAGAPGDAEAIVVRVAGPTAAVLLGGEEHEARLPPRLPGRPAVAGDRVRLRGSGDGDGLVVEEIAPRRTRLDRADGPDRRPRPLVANADLLVVVASVVQPPLRPRLIDRYLVAAAAGDMDGAVAVTKTDLPHDAAGLAQVLERYRSVGYPVVAGCAWEERLLGELRRLIGRRVAILAGHSGVGKSTLAQHLTGVPRAIGEVSRKVGTGRHTTTDPRLIPLRGGGALVDTAGVRTFHLPRMAPATIAAGFPEIAAAASRCRFAGCAHAGDAGCAVPASASPERLESYRRMLEEMR